MMKLLLKRIAYKEDYTIGQLYIDGKFFCDTLEDQVRELPQVCPGTSKGRSCNCSEKVYAETAIPASTYKVVLSYSPRFKRELPRLENVPHFEGILIHRGNTASDSAGCILVGENKVVGKVLNSTFYEQELVKRLRGEKQIEIEIV